LKVETGWMSKRRSQKQALSCQLVGEVVETGGMSKRRGRKWISGNVAASNCLPRHRVPIGGECQLSVRIVYRKKNKNLNGI
jgi:hypothetical protein